MAGLIHDDADSGEPCYSTVSARRYPYSLLDRETAAATRLVSVSRSLLLQHRTARAVPRAVSSYACHLTLDGVCVVWHDGTAGTLQLCSRAAHRYRWGRIPVPIRWVLIRDTPRTATDIGAADHGDFG